MEPAVFEVRFTPAAGANPEYAQGAIERCEALHREIAPLVWVIVDHDGATPEQWTTRLQENLEPGTGRFDVRVADDELRGRALRGEIPLQR